MNVSRNATHTSIHIKENKHIIIILIVFFFGKLDIYLYELKRKLIVFKFLQFNHS